MSDSRNAGSATDESAERALREGLKVNVLSADAMRRIREATEQEWRESTRTSRRQASRFAVAGSFVVVTVKRPVSVRTVAISGDVHCHSWLLAPETISARRGGSCGEADSERVAKSAMANLADR